MVFINVIKMEKNLRWGGGPFARAAASVCVCRLWAKMPLPILSATHYQASLLRIILKQPYQTQASASDAATGVL